MYETSSSTICFSRAARNAVRSSPHWRWCVMVQYSHVKRIIAAVMGSLDVIVSIFHVAVELFCVFSRILAMYGNSWQHLDRRGHA